MDKAVMRVCHHQEKAGDKRMDIVEIYSPGSTDFSFRIGRMETEVAEISDEDAAVAALWAGYDDAWEWADKCGATDGVTFYSEMREALDRFAIESEAEGEDE